MEGKEQTVKTKNKIVFIVLLFLFLCSASCPVLVKAQQNNPQVTANNMRNYAQTLISTYIQEVFQYFPNTTAYWTFYPSTFYNATTYVSSTKGAALLLQPSKMSGSYIKAINTTEPIEIAVFGGNPNLKAWIPIVGGDVTFSFLSEYIEEQPFIDLTSDYSSMIIQGVQLNRTDSQQYYYFVDIKASNSLNFWTTDVAEAEANQLLYDDAGQGFFNSSDYTQLVGIPECSSLLENLKANLTTNTPEQSLSEWQAVQKTAQQLDINDTLLNQLVGFVNAQTTGLLPTFPPKPHQHRTKH